MPPYEQLLAENDSLKEENAVLKAQIAWLQRQLFGPGKSERLDRAQMLLQLQALEQQSEDLEARSQKISYERTRRGNKPRRRQTVSFFYLCIQVSQQPLGLGTMAGVSFGDVAACREEHRPDRPKAGAS